MEKIRTFIAIDFPDEVVKEIARLQGLLENRKFIGKLTELGNLHLTLKFLGEISAEGLNEVEKTLSGIEFRRFEVYLDCAGTFSYKGNPRIVWVKVSGKGVFELQSEIDMVLSGLLPKENRFMSHLTLARVKYVKDKQGFIDYIRRLNVKPVKFGVGSFKLMSSELKMGGHVYTILREYELA